MSNKKPMNSADRQANDKAKKEEKFKRKQALHDIREAMKSPNTRRMIWRFISIAGIFQQSFDNSGWTAFREGKRALGLQLISEIEEAEPGLIGQLMQESLTEELGIQENDNQDEENSNDR